MTLINRFSRLFRADLHAVLDRLEEPEVLLRQALREMQEVTTEDEQRLRKLRHDLLQLTRRDAGLERSIAQLDAELDVSLRSDRDDLARPLVRRKLEAQRLLLAVRERRERAERSCEDLEARIAEQRTRIEELRREAELFGSGLDEPRHPESVAEPSFAPVREEDIEVALIQERQRRRPS